MSEEPNLDRSPPRTGAGGPGAAEIFIRILFLFLLLYGFLVAIETMSKAIKALAESGVGGKDQFFVGVSNPFAGLAIGVLFTVIVQSSSTTTATIVAVVGSGTLSVADAVPMIMGANIGTTITNTLVSIGHVRRSVEFKRAFAAATVHDFFNLLAVAVFLPLELLTGFLSRSATYLAGFLRGSEGVTYKSPIKTAIKSAHEWLETQVEHMGLEGQAMGIMMLILGILLTFLCLYQITHHMKIVVAGKIEGELNRALNASGLVPLAIGIGVTVAVQSSSITTSLLVPMAAAGVLSLDKAFPIMLGANIGTTVTALLASMAQDGTDALTIALVHVLFNSFGVAAWYLIKPIRSIPLRLAEGLAGAAVRSRLWILVYVLGVFVLAPVLGWYLWRDIS